MCSQKPIVGLAGNRIEGPVHAGCSQSHLEVVSRIRLENPRAARRFRVRAEEALRKLAKYPRLDRRIPEFPEAPHREVLVLPYRFFYRVAVGAVWIVGVWHGAQLPRRPTR